MKFHLDRSKKTILKTPKGKVIFENDKIVHIESCRNTTQVYLSDQDNAQILLHKISEILEILKEVSCFYQCHRCYVINTNHIVRFEEKNGIFVTIKGEVPISDSYLNEVKEMFK